MTEFSTSMGAAQRHFDNLSPEDFGPPVEVDCARCLQAVETHTTDYCEVEGEWTCRGECLVVCEACGDTGPLEGATRDEDGWICPDCGTGGEDVAIPAGLGYDRDVLAAAQRIEAAALVLVALIDGANPDVCKRADALLLGRSNAPIGPRRASPPEWRRLFFCEVAETTLTRAQHELTRRQGGE